MTSHPSAMPLNTEMSLRKQWADTKPVSLYTVYGTKVPGSQLGTLTEWAVFDFISFGGWIQNIPSLFHMMAYTRENVDPYERRLNELQAAIIEAFDLEGGLPLRDWTDPNNPTLIGSPADATPPSIATDSLHMAIRALPSTRLKGYGTATEAVNGVLVPFEVYHWRYFKH